MCLLSKNDTIGSLRLRRTAFAAAFADQRRHLAIGLVRCACNRLPARRHKREDEEDKQLIPQYPWTGCMTTCSTQSVGFTQAVMQAYIIAERKMHIFGSAKQHWRHGLNNCLHLLV